MTGRRLALLGVLAAVPVACLSTVAGCRMAGPCGWIPTQGTFWWPAAYVPPLLIALAAALAYTLRLGLVTVRASRDLARLPRLLVPPNLVRNAQSAGIERIACVGAGSPVAFCAGLRRPTVYVSEGALATLSEPELLAVLYHEADHARRHEPLRRVALTAAAEVLRFLPIVGWWSERQIVRSELSADAAAECVVGRSALAGALLVMTAPAIPLAAFVGHAELRARRLLGMGIDEPKPPRAVWAATLVYSWLALSLAGCLFEVVVALRP
ncbi:MAG: M56 family metallopeptidase [Candidatus Dormibacteraceae bacterium]